jgi:serine protease
LTASTVTVEWTGGKGATQYWLSVGTTAGGADLLNQSTGTSLSATVAALPTNGSTLHVRLWSLIGGTWQYNDDTYTAMTPGKSAARAEVTTPAPGSTLTASTLTVEWTGGTGVSQYWLSVGTTAGGADLLNQSTGTSLSATVAGLPTNGGVVHVRLWSLISGAWQYNDDTYTSRTTTAPARAEVTTPAPGSTLAASTVAVEWTGGTGVTQYWLSVGTTAGGADLLNLNSGTNLSATVTGLPTSGTRLYVRLWSLIGGAWQYNDDVYTATTTTSARAEVTTPAPESTLTASTVTVEWTGGTGVSQYRLSVGTTVGATDLFDQNLGASLTGTVPGLPTRGGTLYVRLWSLINGTWQHNDYTYTATTM